MGKKNGRVERLSIRNAGKRTQFFEIWYNNPILQSDKILNGRTYNYKPLGKLNMRQGRVAIFLYFYFILSFLVKL